MGPTGPTSMKLWYNEFVLDSHQSHASMIIENIHVFYVVTVVTTIIVKTVKIAKFGKLAINIFYKYFFQSGFDFKHIVSEISYAALIFFLIQSNFWKKYWKIKYFHNKKRIQYWSCEIKRNKPIQIVTFTAKKIFHYEWKVVG